MGAIKAPMISFLLLIPTLQASEPSATSWMHAHFKSLWQKIEDQEALKLPKKIAVLKKQIADLEAEIKTKNTQVTQETRSLARDSRQTNNRSLIQQKRQQHQRWLDAKNAELKRLKVELDQLTHSLFIISLKKPLK